MKLNQVRKSSRMVFLEWNDSLSMQVKEIDNQHKELFNLTNQAHELDQKKDGEEMGELMNQLIILIDNISCSKCFIDEFIKVAEQIEFTKDNG